MMMIRSVFSWLWKQFRSGVLIVSVTVYYNRRNSLGINDKRLIKLAVARSLRWLPALVTAGAIAPGGLSGDLTPEGLQGAAMSRRCF